MKKYYLINKENTIKYSPLVNADNSQEGGFRFLRRRTNTDIFNKRSRETEKSLRKSQKELVKLEAKRRKYETKKREIQKAEPSLKNKKRIRSLDSKQRQIEEKLNKHKLNEKIHKEKQEQIEDAKKKLSHLRQEHEVERDRMKSINVSTKEQKKELKNEGKELKKLQKKQERSLAMIEAKAIKHGYGSDKHMEAILNRATKLKAKTRFRKSSTLKNEIYKDVRASQREEFRLRAKRFFRWITFRDTSEVNQQLKAQKKITRDHKLAARNPNDKRRQAVLKDYHDKTQEKYLEHYKSKGLDHDSALLAASAATSLKMGRHYQEHQDAKKQKQSSHPHPQHQQHDNIPTEHKQKMKSVVGALEQRNLSAPDHVPSEHKQKMKSVVGALKQRNLSAPDHVPSTVPSRAAAAAVNPTTSYINN